MSELRRINSSRKNSLSDKVKYDSKVSKPDLFSQLSSYIGNITLSSRQITRTVFILISLLFIYYFLSSLDLKIAVTEAEPIFDCSASHETYNMSFNLTLKEYRDYSISVDNEHCSIVGKNIIEKGGSAVDAAIAAGLCNGLMNAQSAGIGGGHFMVIYLKERKMAYAINARERAPMNSFEEMFAEKSSLRGGLATAIPGEIAGFEEAHRIGGRLPWRDLFEPAIRMCSEGYRVSSALAQAIANHEDSIRQDPVLSEIFIDKDTKQIRKLGDLVQRPRLARTLMRLAEKGSKAFYDDATLTGFIIDEINSNGGNVTLKDFQNYRAQVTPALTLDLDHKLKLSTVSLPSSGILTAFIMRIMNKFKLNKRTLDKSVNEGLFYHRLIESFKHAFAHRSLLGDDKTDEINQILERLKDESYIREVQLKINDDHTYPSEYYSKIEPREDHGTAHISVMVGGDAVSLTSTVNTYFGAKYAGRFTGIIYNNEMDDFSTPNKVNYFNLEPSEANFIRPGKRPMSSMSPIIVIDKRSDEPKLVLGASGGSKIITAVAQVAIKALWMDVNIKDAIDDRRVHHQLYPQEAQLEEGFNANIHRLLLNYGHNISCHEIGGSIIQAVHRVEKHKLFAYGDPRKGGIPAGA